jgi:hypothetical protein
MKKLLLLNITDVTQSQRFIKKHIMRSLSRQCVNRVIAPEGEILSFAPPKESIQRKGGSIAAASCAPRFCRGSVERASCPPTDVRHPCRAPSD